MVKLGSHRRCMAEFPDRTRIVPYKGEMMLLGRYKRKHKPS